MPTAVDRGWPHQVALPASVSLGKGFYVVRDFCKDLSLAPRGHSVIGPDNEWWNVYCFADPEHAEKFRLKFGGEKFEPGRRGRGNNWSYWER